MKIEKPPVTSDEQFTEWCRVHQQCNFECGTKGTLLCRLEAQRDADVAYCERQVYEVIKEAALIGIERVQQAKVEVIEIARREVKFSLRQQLIKFPSLNEQEAVSNDLAFRLNQSLDIRIVKGKIDLSSQPEPTK